METQRGNVSFSGLYVYMAVLVYVHVTAGNTNNRISHVSVTQPLSSVLLPFSSLSQSPCEHMCVASMLL